MARRAAARPAGAKANQETAKHDRAEAVRGEQRGPTDEIGGNESGEIPDPETLQGGAGGAGDCDRIGVGEQSAATTPPRRIPPTNVRFQSPLLFQS